MEKSAVPNMPLLRPAFQIIKTLPGVSAVSGAFIMILKNKNFGTDGVVVFADCAVNPDPTVRELAEIAVESAKTAKNIAGIEPRVAMLSFSTKGSAKHEKAYKVVEATKIAKEMNPSLQIDGELQADAAIVEAIGQKKAPGSAIAGKANVLVFPSLESGNIAYISWFSVWPEQKLSVRFCKVLQLPLTTFREAAPLTTLLT